MSETEWTDEDVRRALAEMWEEFRDDPNSVTPGYAGALAHAAALGYEDTEPDDEELDVLMSLLLHGSTHADADPMAGAWRLSLAKCHAIVADRTNSLEHWRQAVEWATFATDYPQADEEEPVEDLLDVIDLHTGRVWTIRDAWCDEVLDPHQAIAEIGDTADLIAKLADRLDDPTARAIADVRRARVLGYRYFIGRDADDLHNAVRLMTDAVFLIPDGFPLQVEDLEMFGDLCLLQEDHEPSLVPVDQAVAAVEKAIALTPDDHPGLPAYHSLAALLLNLHDDPQPRDQLIDHLAGAARADDPEAWAWYASGLQDRGGDNDDVTELLSAADWYRRSAEHPAVQDAWASWAQFVEVHYQLHELDQGPRHADIVIDCATELLKRPSPDTEDVATLHRYRLICAMQNGTRPGLTEFLRDNPVVEWLTDAEQVVEAADGTSRAIGVLATTVGTSWMNAVGHAPPEMTPTVTAVLDVTARIRRMFVLALRYDTDPEFTRNVKLVSELNNNLTRTATGDGDADFSTFQEFLADPARAGEHSHLTDVIGMLSAQVGIRSKALGPLQAARRIFSRPVDSPRDEETQQHLEATQLFYEVIERFQLNLGDSEALELSTKAWDLMSALPPTPSNAPLQAMAETLHRLVATAHSVPIGPRRFDSGSVFAGDLLRPIQLGEDIVQARKNGDAHRLREIYAELELTANDPTPPGFGAHPSSLARTFALDALAAVEPWNREVLEQAIVAYSERCEEFTTRYHPLMDSTVLALGRLLRRRNEPGDRRRSRTLGYDALWHATWHVLQQATAEHALEMARASTSQADELAAWCLTDDAVDDLVRIVDARRGLVLKAATTAHVLADQLSEAGQTELAERWTSADGRDTPLLPGWTASSDNWGGLRRTVLRKLADESDDLITPPSVGEIQAALREHGSDALAYLLPANKHHTGQAVVVPAEGEAFTNPLPFLRTDDAPQRYREAYDAWSEAQDATGPECDRWRDQLAELCEWAWGVAGGELLRVLGRDLRVVLVPVGPLGIVPWHAAVRTDKGVPRYLVQDMSISYVPSARLFCDVVARAEVTEGRPVLVGNPARDLPAGAAEATAVRDAFHPDGLFLGGHSRAPRPWKPSPDGSGTPAQVLAALRKPLPLLHLACHAVADMRQPLQSHVRLATAHLSAVELLELSPVDVVPLGIVNLAGCTTNVSGVDYDEALSLATTFLAIGARTVIGSLWRVPAGRSTAHLMFMFYHYLRTERPADALRRAQLWMLDEGREFPGTMPESLRALPPSAAFDPADVASWAGFTQLGR